MWPSGSHWQSISETTVEPDSAITLTDEQLDRLADRLAIRLAAVKPAVQAMLTVDDICATLRVSRAWVYENASRLGGVKLGNGQRAPLRFDPIEVRRLLEPLSPGDQPEQPDLAPRQRRGKGRLHPVYDG
jgi:hypothetical protein